MPLSIQSLCLIFCAALLLHAQTAENPKPDERFKVDLLVVVAHPDDESEIGAYLARAIFDEQKRVAVVFGTRGNQGGNGVGQEQAAALGAIREIEGRRALGRFGVSEVWFLNGTDTPGQVVLDSLETWGHGDALQRMVRLLRLTRPSVVATWLPDRVAGEDHGDHQAAGVIATEAFDLAGDATAFPEQLAAPRNRWDVGNLTEGLCPWQPEKLYYFSDAADKSFMKGQGPTYAATDISPSQHASYARLAAEECAFHLTQSDSGQAARAALAKNDFSHTYFADPVYFVFGKSYVPSGITADLFAGVTATPIPYHRAPGYVERKEQNPSIELGGSWHFYREFWPAHGIEHLAQLLSPEIMAQFLAPLTIPVIINNPASTALDVKLAVAIPAGWKFVQALPTAIRVDAQDSATVQIALKTAAEQRGWKTIDIHANSEAAALGDLRIRVELDNAAMPE
jgi:LmbE family N-acetylglucosaminyl deacetylase